jgi:integral membrane protein
MSFSTKPDWLSVLAWLEGASLIGLIMAMPLKYLFHLPQVVKIWGMAHGLLFLLYLLGFWSVALSRRWPLKTLFMGSLVSVVPFGFLLSDDYLPPESGRDLTRG